MVKMNKIRILVEIDSPQWANTHIFINDKYKNNVQSFEHSLSAGEVARLEMVFINKIDRKYTRTFIEGYDDIKFTTYDRKLAWKEILELLR